MQSFNLNIESLYTVEQLSNKNYIHHVLNSNSFVFDELKEHTQ